MVANDSMTNLEMTVKTLLQQRSMSMRKLGTLTGIHVTTISKMLTGKQRVNPKYLQRIAHALAIPVEELFKAAGFYVGTEGDDEISLGSSNDLINEILQYLGHNRPNFSPSELERELDKYEGYAKTDEGKTFIVDQYPQKRKQMTGSGTFCEDLDSMYERFMQESTSEGERAILGSGLLYFVLATDVIPDYVFPIGYVDDVLAVQITQKRICNFKYQFPT